MSSADEAADAPPAGEEEAEEVAVEAEAEAEAEAQAEEEAQEEEEEEEADAQEAPAAAVAAALEEEEPQAAPVKQEKPPLPLTHVSALRPGTSGHNLIVKARAQRCRVCASAGARSLRRRA
jgi:sRNA-binding protein